jgi:hypothetical protein
MRERPLPPGIQVHLRDFSLTLTAVFQPPCSPPMTVEFTNVSVTDTTNGISVKLSGTF